MEEYLFEAPLSTRTLNAIYYRLSDGDREKEITKSMVKEAIEARLLKPGRPRNYGQISHAEACKWVGIKLSGQAQYETTDKIKALQDTFRSLEGQIKEIKKEFVSAKKSKKLSYGQWVDLMEETEVPRIIEAFKSIKEYIYPSIHYVSPAAERYSMMIIEVYVNGKFSKSKYFKPKKGHSLRWNKLFVIYGLDHELYIQVRTDKTIREIKKYSQRVIKKVQKIELEADKKS